VQGKNEALSSKSSTTTTTKKEKEKYQAQRSSFKTFSARNEKDESLIFVESWTSFIMTYFI
jgi:hypothetical protein